MVRLRGRFAVEAQTVHRRFTGWSAARVWAKLHRVALDRLGANGEPDGRGASSTRPAPGWSEGASDWTESDRSRKIRVEGPRHLRPLSGANLHGRQVLIPPMRGMSVIRSRFEPRRQRPAELLADKGYGLGELRGWLRGRRIEPCIAGRGLGPSGRLAG